MSELIAPWNEIGRVAATSLAIYFSMLVSIRLAGRRTISQMSGFDVVVTVAIGSLMATSILTPNVNFTLGMTSIVTLLLSQQAVAAVRQRSTRVRKLLDFSPETVYDSGELRLRQSLLAAQVTEAEILSNLRQRGFQSLEEVRLVILEPDGKISAFPVLAPPGK